MTQLSKTGVISVLSSTVKLLTLSFFVGFGLASCSHSSGDEAEPVDAAAEVAPGDAAPGADASASAEAPAADGAEAATADVTKTEPADAPPVLDEAAPPAELADAAAPAAEQPVAAVDEAPAAPAPEEIVADHPQEPTLPDDDVTSDTVKAELTDKAPTPPPAAPARAAPEAPAAAPEAIADSFENKAPTPEANGAIVEGNSISSPGAARFIKSVHQKKGSRSHKVASTHIKHGKGKGRATASAATGAAGGNYVVVPGDTLGRISKKIYGDTKQWKTLADLNGLVDPFLIRVGEVVKFDDTSEKAKAYLSSHKTAMKSVTVKDGDSLSKIAAAVYGDSSKWTLLLNLNKDKISDANHIATGMSLAYVEAEGAPAQAQAAAAPAAPAAKAQKATAKAHKKKAPAAAGAVKESH